MKGEDFSRISFLRLMAEICNVEEHKQIYLSFYAFYLMYVENKKSCLLAIEKGLQIHEETLPASLLLAIKAAILTQISKYFTIYKDILRLCKASRKPFKSFIKSTKKGALYILNTKRFSQTFLPKLSN